MASIRNDIPISAPADKVWDAVRDFGALHERLAPGFVTACTLDGDARIVTFANGSVAREVLVDCDDARCRLVWIIDVLPNELAAYIQGQTKEAVGAIHRAFPPAAA